VNIVLRSFLTALALLSLQVFCSPAAAGMIATPAADRESGEAREAALSRAAARLPGEAAGLRDLPTAERLLLANAPEAALHASNDAIIALAIVAGIVLFVAMVITLVIISKVQHFHRHFGGDRSDDRASLTPECPSK